MEYTRLGDTGLRISRLALGCMSYGDSATEGAHRWALADDEAQPFFRQAIELGITFWDTANAYQAGTSEEVTGRAIRRYTRREDIVLATKGVRQDARRSRRIRPVPESNHGADRRLPGPARYRLR